MKHRKRAERARRTPARAHIRPQPGPRPPAAYAEPLDAVVLAGTHETARHLIQGRNKSFLPLGGKPLLRWVVDGLLRSARVDRVFVVGPVAELEQVLLERPARVRLVQQDRQLIANAWAGFQASEKLRGAGGRGDPDRPVLFLSSDLPLLTPEAVDDFIARCAERDRRSRRPGALLTGIAEEASLAPFVAAGGRPGIERPFVELRSGRYRLANIYVARPLRMGHREVLQHGFSHRKAKDWQNVLGLAWSFFRQRGGWRGAWQVLLLQAARLASHWPGRVYRALRRRNTEEQIEAVGSLLLDGPLRLVVTPYGGLSIDVDDERDYGVLQERFADWAPHLREATGARPA